MDYLWLGIAYGAGTLFTIIILGPEITKKAIESTIDTLMAKGVIRYKRDQNGEIEILKWNESE